MTDQGRSQAFLIHRREHRAKYRRWFTIDGQDYGLTRSKWDGQPEGWEVYEIAPPGTVRADRLVGDDYDDLRDVRARVRGDIERLEPLTDDVRSQT